MKKLMIISYQYPPRPGIGSQRPYRLAKYLPEYGWEPIILTAKLPGKPPEGIQVIQTGYKDVAGNIKSKIGFDSRKGLHEQLGIPITKNYYYSSWKSKAIKLTNEVISYPDTRRGWYKFAVKSAEELLSQKRVDAIISTSSPVTSHLIAQSIKQKFNIPWISDLRDPWTQNPYHNKFGVIKYFEKQLEIRILKYADLVVTVTEPWIDMLMKLHKKEILCVSNGFDPIEFTSADSQLTSKFTITYTGQLYNGKRDPSVLFRVLEELIKENEVKKELIELRFYGPIEKWIEDEIKIYNLNDIVNLFGSVSREEAIKKQRESQLLLLLLWNNKSEEGFCPGKIYEYFGSMRPIIAYGWSGSIVKKMMEITNTGRFADSPDNLKIILLEYYKEFILHGKLSYKGNTNTNDYSYTSIAKKYADILNDLMCRFDA